MKHYAKSYKRSILKTISYQIVSTFITILILYFVSGKADLAVQLGLLSTLIKCVFYFVHEKLWND